MRIYDSYTPPLRSIPSLLLGNDGIEIEGMRMLMYTSQDIYSSSLFFTSTLKVAKFRSARTKRKSKRLFRIVVSRSGKVADVHLQLPTPLCDVANLLNYFRNRKHLNKKTHARQFESKLSLLSLNRFFQAQPFSRSCKFLRQR